MKTVVEEVLNLHIILLLRNKRLKFVKFYISKTRHGIEFLFGMNVYIVKETNHADLQGDAIYWFSVIDNWHSAVKYFFHYNHGPN